MMEHTLATLREKEYIPQIFKKHKFKAKSKALSMQTVAMLPLYIVIVQGA